MGENIYNKFTRNVFIGKMFINFDMWWSNIKFPTLMGSVGGWVFVLDVTRGLNRRKFYLFREIAI